MWKRMIVGCLMMAATLSAEVKVLGFAGSTRKDSVNKKLIAEAAKIARGMKAQVTVIDLKDYLLPFYDEDLETKEGMPAKAKQLRRLMLQSDVLLIASPEYNGSLSATLKNTIDWVSRGERGGVSLEPFKNKKIAILSASPGSFGGVRGLGHLRTILENIGGEVMSQQVVLPDAYTAFDAQGHLKNAQIKKEIEQLMQAAIDEKS